MLKQLFIIGIAVTGFALSASASKESSSNLKDMSLKMVPGGTVIEEDGNEFEVQTTKNTIVEVELNSDGSIDEASGDAAETGDIFVPENDLLTLSGAVEALKKSGGNTTGEWELEKSFLNGWVYEFEGSENGKEKEYVINAKNGKLL